jgi:hypothetical protein
MMDGVKVSGFTVLFLGSAVLLFTFYNAYFSLMGILEIVGSTDLMILFGEALTPLITNAIRVLYLGVMGWIGSIMTRRGVHTITYEGLWKKKEGKKKGKVVTSKVEAVKENKTPK